MYLDSPFEICPHCREPVLLDQSQADCAREHGCGNKDCPLSPLFTGETFPPDPRPEPTRKD